jgi:hypothetical protein
MNMVKDFLLFSLAALPLIGLGVAIGTGNIRAMATMLVFSALASSVYTYFLEKDSVEKFLAKHEKKREDFQKKKLRKGVGRTRGSDHATTTLLRRIIIVLRANGDMLFDDLRNASGHSYSLDTYNDALAFLHSHRIVEFVRKSRGKKFYRLVK